MTAHNIPLLSRVLHWFQDSSEAKGVVCRGCECRLPPNNWVFVSNENFDDREKRYNDNVVCFFTEHEKCEQQCYKVSTAFSMENVGMDSSAEATYTTKRVLDYVRVGGPLSRAEDQDGYYCLNCFVVTRFRTRGRDVRDRIKNEAATLCNKYDIGVAELPTFTREDS